jgi:hypothetical protein
MTAGFICREVAAYDRGGGYKDLASAVQGLFYSAT